MGTGAHLGTGNSYTQKPATGPVRAKFHGSMGPPWADFSLRPELRPCPMPHNHPKKRSLLLIFERFSRSRAQIVQIVQRRVTTKGGGSGLGTNVGRRSHPTHLRIPYSTTTKITPTPRSGSGSTLRGSTFCPLLPPYECLTLSGGRCCRHPPHDQASYLATFKDAFRHRSAPESALRVSDHRFRVSLVVAYLRRTLLHEPPPRSTHLSFHGQQHPLTSIWIGINASRR